jgi:dienelactone hydrolase
MRYLIPIVLVLFLSLNAYGELRTEAVEYADGGTALEGYLAYDDAVKGKRPGVLVVHEWWGLNPYIKGRAEELARLGYIAFAVDMYGKGRRASTAGEAGALAGTYLKDRGLMRSRAQAGLEVLRKHALTDPGRLAAIGYCFGGTTVLELARSGADIAGVASFHGGLATPSPEDAANIKGKVLVLHGADDPFVKAEQVAAFQEEMRKAGVDWQMMLYGGAVHSFTNPASGDDPSKGVAYNERADRRSWEAMRLFFREIFGGK